MNNLYGKLKFWGSIIGIILGVFGIINYFFVWRLLKSIILGITFIGLYLWRYPQIIMNVVFILWLLALSYLVWVRIKKIRECIFKDNFKRGTEKWDYEFGETKTENNELSVSKCYSGILTRGGQNWGNCEFKFQSKIIKECSGWIVRAKDFNNYVMFQFTKEKIRLHYRIEGCWDVPEEKLINNVVDIKDNEWFSVKIKINGDSALIFINNKEVYYRNDVFSKHPSNTDVHYISFPIGRVGFRQSGDERALFKNVKVYLIS